MHTIACLLFGIKVKLFVLLSHFFTFQALLSAAVACAAQYYKDDELSNLSDWEFDRASLFYVVFIIGLVIVLVLFVCFLFNLNKRCGSPKGWSLFVSISALLFISICKSEYKACFTFSTLPLSPGSFTDAMIGELEHRRNCACAGQSSVLSHSNNFVDYL